jgi:hypothetical protein
MLMTVVIKTNYLYTITSRQQNLFGDKNEEEDVIFHIDIINLYQL